VGGVGDGRAATRIWIALPVYGWLNKMTVKAAANMELNGYTMLASRWISP
jgi:hypothetical protein